MSEEKVEKGIKRNADGTFAVGYEGGPGRPPETPEQKIVKRAIKDLVKEYKEDLAQYLPEIKAKLAEKAVSGDIQFIKELHDRVMGKPEQQIKGDPDNPVMPILVKFINERQPDNNNRDTE